MITHFSKQCKVLQEIGQTVRKGDIRVWQKKHSFRLDPGASEKSRPNSKKTLLCQSKGVLLFQTISAGFPGEILFLDSAGEGRVEIACAVGSIYALRLLPEGKGRMSAADFIRGRRVTVGDIWS